MSHRPGVHICLLMLLGIPAFSDPDWNTLRSQAVLAASRGSLQEAEALVKSAIALAPASSVQALSLWCQLGAIHHEMGLLDQAESDSEHALSIDTALQSPDEIQAAIALNNLAMVAGERRNHAKAQGLLLQAQSRLGKANRTDRTVEVLVKTNLAFTLQQMRQYAAARRLYEEIDTEVASVFGSSSTEYARLLANQALFELECADIGSSIEHGRAALSIERKLPYMNPVVYAGTLSNLGLALTQRGEFKEAEALLSEAIRRQQEIHGDADELIASLTNLVSLQEKDRRLDEAKQTSAQVLRLMTGQEHVSDRTRATILSNAGRIALDEGRYHEARKYLTEACTFSEKTLGDTDAQYAGTLSNLAALESAQKNHKRAEALYRKAWDIDQGLLGPKHPEVASDISNTATQMFYLNHRREALDLYERARVIMEASYGSISAPVAQTWENIAVVYFTNKEFTNAVDAYGRAVSALTQATDGQDRRLPGWLHAYAVALRKTGQSAEAEAADTRAVGLEVRAALAAEKRQPSVRGLSLRDGKT